MEKMISALPEYAGQVSVETFETLLHILSVLAVNQIKDNVTCAVCIWPFLHFERELELSLAHFEEFRGAVVVFKRNRIGNVVILDQFARLATLYDVLVVCMQSVRNFSKFFFALELCTKVKKLSSRLVVQINEPRILAKSIENDFIGLKEEVDSREKSVSLNQLIKITVCKQNELVRCGFPSLEDSLLGVLLVRAWVVSKKECYFIDSFFCFNFLENFVVFLHEILEHWFKKWHALVLTQISEVLEVFAESCRVVVLDANVDEIILSKWRV